ncbi:PREDICTED: polycomb group protein FERTILIZATION-INDEPENDENT ENDOSPERM-like [Brassica oleracea var. oleracea]|uniref:polycomb group protein FERTILIZATION-INDEPENDENT ENDOSPERM-like n=1 Tax=Brassica oleracea var. oleracea TaxID=109376 RepID=UPI0006A6BF4F|nr:PREDICTED: polycomb group protein FERTILIZATION-INDEPENDENT ENDOSPERM-like [Brassica oleracea var. oleracea]
MATGQVIVEEMNPKSDDQYKAWKTLDHPTKLKAVASNHLLSSFYRFAVAGGNMVTICELPNDAANNLVLNEKPYIDDTVVESFLAVSWAEKDDTHYILAGGLMCIIRSSITLSGHDDSITDIQCSPFDNALVLSASQDRTVRLWSTKAGVCLIKCCQKSESSVPLLSVSFYLSDTSSVLGTKKLICGLRKITRPKRENKLANPSLERITAVPSIDCVRCLETQALSQVSG